MQLVYLTKVFSTGTRSKNFIFAFRVRFFRKKLDTEKYCKGQRVHSADQSSLGTKIWQQLCKISKCKGTYWGQGHFQLTFGKMITTTDNTRARNTKSSTKMGTNVIKQVSSKTLRSQTFESDSIKSQLKFVNLLLLLNLFPNTQHHSAVMSAVTPQGFDCSDMYNPRLIFYMGYTILFPVEIYS